MDGEFLRARDRATARPGVYMPEALDRQYPRAGSRGRGIECFRSPLSRPILASTLSAATTFMKQRFSGRLMRRRGRRNSQTRNASNFDAAEALDMN